MALLAFSVSSCVFLWWNLLYLRKQLFDFERACLGLLEVLAKQLTEEE